MRLTKLSLTGFKSFVESSEFAIEPGLTGVVGPNGCGKSNLVEALQWVMGETSAKQLRGGGMEDVIFNGTDTRPARNIASVVLTLDNSDRKAPARFNDDKNIEVTRYIERGEGSTYSVNGEEVRARDVQLLFADFATGAHSSALVGQGRVNDIINAKPSKRRGLLEEASGITGLHARRHEAELRLKAAENNLERLQDVINTLEGQMHGLKRQTRQANRYKKIADELKKNEAKLLYLRWSHAAKSEAEAISRLNKANLEVEQYTLTSATATNEREKSAEIIPPLRESESDKASNIQRLLIANERLDEKQQQIELKKESLENLIQQITGDLLREEELSGDAEKALQNLKDELEILSKALSEESETEISIKNQKEEAQREVVNLEESIGSLTETVAGTETRRLDLENRIATLKQSLGKLQEQKADQIRNLEKINSDYSMPHSSLSDQKDSKESQENLDHLRNMAKILAAELEEARGNEEINGLEKQKAETSLERLKAESSAIHQILGESPEHRKPSVINEITITPGYESALGTGLGDDLEAPTDNQALIYWADINFPINMPNLPEGSEKLSNFVKGPKHLAKRLSQIGVVKEQDGPLLREKLSPGQRLVSQEGSLWRWDGYTVKAEASTPAAARIKQRNRLSLIEKDQAQAQDVLQKAIENYQESTQKRIIASEKFDSILQKLDKFSEYQSQITEISENLARLGAHITEVQSQIVYCTDEIEDIPEVNLGRIKLDSMREDLAVARSSLENKTQIFLDLKRKSEERINRIKEISQEEQAWLERGEIANRRMADLNDRKVTADHDLQKVDKEPNIIDTRRKSLLNEIEVAERERKDSADKLALAETELSTKEKFLRNAEQTLANSREAMVREEGSVEQCKQALQIAESQIQERLDCTPKEAQTLAELESTGQPANTEEIELRIQRLSRERENIGPVNLRADKESEEIFEQVKTLTSERDDLLGAIARLRQGIANLNKEGREKIIEAFGTIDGHFQDLFTKLFGGGHAYLEMVGSDDPLEAGLEIMASPPGKKLQTLSLLSGGEKALTATALIFAAFLTNPAPICVLDEVDAPLDDTNVGRFCDLVTDLASTTDTRFIVITHHRMTMTRVDRLYGVTMAERGVSQLVSVDLDNASEWRETA